MNIIVAIIAIAAALVLGGAAGFMIFRFVIKGKYNEMVNAAKKEAEVIKEKKLLEVKEKFLNKKAELEKEVVRTSWTTSRRASTTRRNC